MKTPAFQFYPKDWLEFKVLRMTDAAQGVYIRLLCHIWIGTETQYSIQNDDRSLARTLGVQITKWKKIKSEFQQGSDPIFIEENGYLISKRLKKEYEKQMKYREVRSMAGKKGMKSRYNKRSNKNITDRITNNLTKSNTPSSSSTSSSTSKQLKDTTNVVDKRHPELQAVVDYATEKGFSIQGSQKINRRYAYNLLRKKDAQGEPLGSERVKKLIDLAVASRGEPYVPQVNDFKQLFYKWADLLSAVEKKQKGGRIGNS